MHVPIVLQFYLNKNVLHLIHVCYDTTWVAVCIQKEPSEMVKLYSA